MKESIELKVTFDVNPSTLYNAWLSSEEHSKMTGAMACCSKDPGGSFYAWDGYISGENIKLEEGIEIMQKWRTTAFNESDESSDLTLKLKDLGNNKTELILIHTNIPSGQTQYEQGWIEHYFIPMKNYFKN